MPIQVACEECGKRYRYSDERAGQTVECKACGSDIEIPGGRQRAGKKKKTKKSSGLPVAVLAGGGFAALAVIGLLALLLSNRKQAALPTPPGAVTGEQALAANPAQPPPAIIVPAIPGTPSTPANSGTIPPDLASQPNPANPTPATSPVAPPANTKPVVSGAASGFRQSKKAKGFKPVENWKVSVDPSPDAVVLDESKPFKIKTATGFSVESVISYPTTPSPFVLVGQEVGSKDPMELWNIVTGTKAATIKGPKTGGRDCGISPDGSLFAWFRHEGGGGGIEVYDIKAKKSLGVLPVDSTKFNVARVCLPTPKRIVALSNVHRSILSWTLPSGDLEREITMGENGQPDPLFAFSPGGRFLAVVSDYLKESVDIYDMDSGDKAGSLAFVDRGPDLFGIAFSLDGTQLAAVYAKSYTADAERVAVWNVADGAITADFELPDPDQRKRDLLSSKAGLQWFPDGKRLLFCGQYVIDLDSKSVVFELPKPTLDFARWVTRRIVSNTSIAAWEGTKKSATIEPIVVQADDIARAKEVAAAGGLLFDTKLPRLTAFDRSKAADRSDMNSAWKAGSDPASGTASLLDSVPFNVDEGRCREIEFSSSNSGIACARIADEGDPSSVAMKSLFIRTQLITGNKRSRIRSRVPPLPCLKNWLEIVDASKQAPSRRIDVSFPCELMAVSPDGSQVLVQAIDGEGRLDVFSADGQHVAGCRPYQEESDKLKREIASAVFLNANTVAAASMDDQLIVFRLPACEPVYSLDDAGTVAISPGGKYIATCAQDRVELRDALSGESRGVVPVEGTVLELSFSVKGDKLAALTDGRRGTAVIVIDLATGSATSVPIPQATLPMVWCGENELLLGNPLTNAPSVQGAKFNVGRSLMLLDLSRKAIVWSYVYDSQDNLTFGRKTFDGRFWLAGAGDRGKPGQIKAISLPEPATAKLLEGKTFDAQALVHPGGSIGLKFECPDPAGVSGYSKKVREQIENGIKLNELTIDEKSPVKMVVSIAPLNESGSVAIKMLGVSQPDKAPDFNLQRKGASVRIAYETGGKAIWESNHQVFNYAFGLVRIPEGKDLQAYFDQLMWQRASNLIDGSIPPSHVFASDSTRGLGSSRLTEKGALPVKKLPSTNCQTQKLRFCSTASESSPTQWLHVRRSKRMA
jgi:WD40 repeat protein